MQHEGTAGGGRVDVVATASSLEEMEGRLDGWRDVVGEWGSVHWLRERLGLPETDGEAEALTRPSRRASSAPPESRRRPQTWPSSAQGTSTESSVGESRATT